MRRNLCSRSWVGPQSHEPRDGTGGYPRSRQRRSGRGSAGQANPSAEDPSGSAEREGRQFGYNRKKKCGRGSETNRPRRPHRPAEQSEPDQTIRGSRVESREILGQHSQFRQKRGPAQPRKPSLHGERRCLYTCFEVRIGTIVPLPSRTRNRRRRVPPAGEKGNAEEPAGEGRKAIPTRRNGVDVRIRTRKTAQAPQGG